MHLFFVASGFSKIVRAIKYWEDGFNYISFVLLLFGEVVWVIAFSVVLRRCSFL